MHGSWITLTGYQNSQTDTFGISSIAEHESKCTYIIVRPKVSWTGLICHTHQCYHRQWLTNTQWSNSRRASAR